MRVGWCAGADAAAHVLVPALLEDLTVAGGDGHHLQRVRRLRAGERVSGADGAGTWRLYEVTNVAPGTVSLRALDEPHRELELRPKLTLAFALTKGQRPEVVVRQCSELGADAVWPVAAARSVTRWPAGRGDAARERLRRVAREAAGQCRRARLLEVRDPAPLDTLAEVPGLVVADRDGVPAAELDDPGRAWTVVVGPEGGLEPEEHERLGNPPRLAVGPHVLRAETAAIAVVAALAGRRTPDAPSH